MKSLIKFLWIIPLAILIAFTFTACGNGSTDDDPPGPVQKKLTITGLTGLSGDAVVQLYPIAMAVESPIGEDTTIPMGSSSFTFNLYESDGSDVYPWTGSADVYVFLTFFDLGVPFLYTNGSTLAELGISDFMDDPLGNMEKLPKLAFNQDVTTVDMGKFKTVVVGP